MGLRAVKQLDRLGSSYDPRVQTVQPILIETWFNRQKAAKRDCPRRRLPPQWFSPAFRNKKRRQLSCQGSLRNRAWLDHAIGWALLRKRTRSSGDFSSCGSASSAERRSRIELFSAMDAEDRKSSSRLARFLSGIHIHGRFCSDDSDDDIREAACDNALVRSVKRSNNSNADLMARPFSIAEPQ